MNLKEQWRGLEDREDGFGQFENEGPEIHFNCYSDFEYISNLIKSVRSACHQIGREDALAALNNYVRGVYQAANSRSRPPPPLTPGFRRK